MISQIPLYEFQISGLTIFPLQFYLFCFQNGRDAVAIHGLLFQILELSWTKVKKDVK